MFGDARDDAGGGGGRYGRAAEYSADAVVDAVAHVSGDDDDDNDDDDGGDDDGDDGNESDDDESDDDDERPVGRLMGRSVREPSPPRLDGKRRRPRTSSLSAAMALREARDAL